MATEVKFGPSHQELKRKEAALEFRVLENSAKAGRLKLSKGGAMWYPKHTSRTNYKLTWKQLGKMMKEHGKKMQDPKKE